MHIVANLGLLDVALILIEHGADVNIRDIQGKTPLHVASSLEIALEMKKRADVISAAIEYSESREDQNMSVDTKLSVMREQQSQISVLKGDVDRYRQQAQALEKEKADMKALFRKQTLDIKAALDKFKLTVAQQQKDAEKLAEEKSLLESSVSRLEAENVSLKEINKQQRERLAKEPDGANARPILKDQVATLKAEVSQLKVYRDTILKKHRQQLDENSAMTLSMKQIKEENESLKAALKKAEKASVEKGNKLELLKFIMNDTNEEDDE